MKKSHRLWLPVLLVLVLLIPLMAMIAQGAPVDPGDGDVSLPPEHTAPKVYTVTFLSYDDSVVAVQEYSYGAVIVPPAAPEKPSDSSGAYTFIGWGEMPTYCIENGTYTAQYELVTVTSKSGWKYENGKWYYYENGITVKNQWRTDSVGAVYLGSDGAMVTDTWCINDNGWCYVNSSGYCVKNTWMEHPNGWLYLGSNGAPVKNTWKDKDGQRFYLGSDGFFVTNDWQLDGTRYRWLSSDGSVAKAQWLYVDDNIYYVDANGYRVTGTQSISGRSYSFDSNGVLLDVYTVQFVDHDGTVLSSASYKYGDTVTIPADPSRPSDKRGSYAFAGWDKAVTAATANATYTATYTCTYYTYTVTFYNYDGTLISSGEYRYGDPIEAPADPTRESGSVYQYTFIGWDRPVGTCTGDDRFIANYERSYVEYTVTFLDYDGREIASTLYTYGDIVELPAAPSRANDDRYSYTFAGWTPEVTEVTANATYTATYTATELPPQAAILSHPQAVSTDSGNNVTFTVKTEGPVVSWQWQYRKIYKWFNTSMEGYNTDTLTVSATGARNGYDYRCVVTFADGTVMESEPAELTVKTYLTVTGQPNDQTVVLGSKGQFTAAAEGEGIQYQWQYKRPDGTTWIDTAMEGATKPTVLIETTKARDGYQYRCKITDVTGNESFTEAATMRVLSFKSHPDETFAATNATVKFSVATSVEGGFTYQWQYRRSATAAWTNTTLTGNNTATLTVSATKARNGYEYRCVITGSKNSTIESKAAVLHVGDPVVITAQPANKTVSAGQVASFSVTATNAYSYQWQYQRPTGTTWSNTSADGNQTATLNVTTKASNNGYKYRCIITGLDGTQTITEVATLTIG